MLMVLHNRLDRLLGNTEREAIDAASADGSSHCAHEYGGRMTGMRSWKGATRALASVVRMVPSAAARLSFRNSKNYAQISIANDHLDPWAAVS